MLNENFVAMTQDELEIIDGGYSFKEFRTDVADFIIGLATGLLK